jgi:sulfur-oxidizing protein SoxZ
MSQKPTPRVRVQASAKKDEVIEIKTLISHEMESGQRKDAQGATIPRKIIKAFEAKFNGKTVFAADWHPAISANPYQSFFYKVVESGEFEFTWTDDDGSLYQSKNKLTVA